MDKILRKSKVGDLQQLLCGSYNQLGDLMDKTLCKSVGDLSFIAQWKFNCSRFLQRAFKGSN